jgi:hypothetical protein
MKARQQKASHLNIKEEKSFTGVQAVAEIKVEKMG